MSLPATSCRNVRNGKPDMYHLCPSAIDGVACFPGSKWEGFREVAFRVFEHGITWERIAVLFYVAGKLAVQVT